MNEQEHSSQLSALFDGELPAQQAGMVIRRALRDTGMQHSWERYALIGACLRGEPIAGRASVAERVQARLASERELNVAVLPARASGTDGQVPRSSLWGRGALGSAIAAGVAVVSIVVVRNMAPVAPDTATMLAQGDAVAGVIEPLDGPAGYTTPGENSPAQRRLLDASLSHYLVAHSEASAAALRSSYDPVVGETDLTEDQLSALR